MFGGLGEICYEESLHMLVCIFIDIAVVAGVMGGELDGLFLWILSIWVRVRV